jgi:TatD DNase family protein
VVHSFAGSDVQARQLIGLGFLLGFGGAVTYPRARRLRALVSGLPATAILLETDAPYQPLWGHPGERNEPVLLAEILNTVAGLRGESARDLAAITTANARTLFSISAQEQPA